MDFSADTSAEMGFVSPSVLVCEPLKVTCGDFIDDEEEEEED